ncbi:MAG: flagellar basal body-associated FliL family protein [Proteobacteria bacterium]|nr:flagellar basal body-associated FliL family protein [Pseudomonadota bacterium]
MATSPTIATPPSRPSKLLIAALISLSLGALGVAAYALTRTKGEAEPTKQVVVEKPIFVALEPITVNVQGEGRNRFLHVGMSLKVRDDKAKAQVMEFMPELRSRALMMLSNRQADSLQSTEDKARLAAEIQAELSRPLNDTLPPQGIVGVSFNAFVVQ